MESWCDLPRGSLHAGRVTGELVACWALLRAPLRRRLVDAGWTASLLGTLSDISFDSLQEVLAQTASGRVCEIVEEDVLAFAAVTGLAALLARRQEAGAAELTLGERALDTARGLKRARLVAEAASTAVELPPVPPRGCRQRWPSRHLKLVAGAGVGTSLGDIEIKERARWLVVLLRIIRGAQLPVLAEAEGAMDPDRLLKHGGRGRRASTLRQRVKTWLRAERWFFARY
jgi:hypothetical protein